MRALCHAHGSSQQLAGRLQILLSLSGSDVQSCCAATCATCQGCCVLLVLCDQLPWTFTVHICRYSSCGRCRQFQTLCCLQQQGGLCAGHVSAAVYESAALPQLLVLAMSCGGLCRVYQGACRWSAQDMSAEVCVTAGRGYAPLLRHAVLSACWRLASAAAHLLPERPSRQACSTTGTRPYIFYHNWHVFWLAVFDSVNPAW